MDLNLYVFCKSSIDASCEHAQWYLHRYCLHAQLGAQRSCDGDDDKKGDDPCKNDNSLVIPVELTLVSAGAEES